MIDACTVCHGRGFVDICAPGGQSRVLESEECPRCALPRALRWGRKVADAIKLGEPGSGTIKAIACDLPAAAEEIERLQAENAALKRRPVIDDAMVERLAAALWNERALSKWSEIAARAERPTSAWRKTVSAERARSLKLLEAALNGGE